MNNGLTNTFVSSLAIDPATPTILYAGTNSGGVFKSTDGGGLDPMNDGLTNTFVSSLAIDPETSTTLYAGTYPPPFTGPPGGVFKSSNGGGE